MIPPPPRSTLFPYTTLFRSSSTTPTPTPPRSGSSCRTSRRSRPEPPIGKRGSHEPANEPGSRSVACPQCHRSEEHTSELQSHSDLVCRLLLEKKKKSRKQHT